MTILFLAALALVAAALHAVWNLRLKGAGDPLATSARGTAASAAVITPPAAAIWWTHGHPGLPPLAWVLLAGSALAELAYFEFLTRAYRTGELATVYPVARGTGPVIAVVGGLLLLGERPHPLQLAGVLALLAGIWIARGVRRPRAGAGLALATGLMIGVYTILDGRAVRLVNPFLFLWWLWIALAVLLAIRTRLRPHREGDWGESTLIGLLMVGTFALALYAYSVAPVSIFAPLRESAVVVVTAWGVWALPRRRDAAVRLAGALAIVVGVGLLALG